MFRPEYGQPGWVGMNRRDFQRPSDIRSREARKLLSARQFSGAFYLAGYAIECALKACIARHVRQHEFPDLTAVRRNYTHDLAELIRAAGLEADLSNGMQVDPAFAVNWTVVKDWSEQSRYSTHSGRQARDIVDAIHNPAHGVLQWIQARW